MKYPKSTHTRKLPRIKQSAFTLQAKVGMIEKLNNMQKKKIGPNLSGFEVLTISVSVALTVISKEPSWASAALVSFIYF